MKIDIFSSYFLFCTTRASSWEKFDRPRTRSSLTRWKTFFFTSHCLNSPSLERYPSKLERSYDDEWYKIDLDHRIFARDLLRFVCSIHHQNFVSRCFMSQPDDDRAASSRLRGSSSLSDYSISNQPSVLLSVWVSARVKITLVLAWNISLTTTNLYESKSLSWLTNTLDSRCDTFSFAVV